MQEPIAIKAKNRGKTKSQDACPSGRDEIEAGETGKGLIAFSSFWRGSESDLTFGTGISSDSSSDSSSHSKGKRMNQKHYTSPFIWRCQVDLLWISLSW